MFVYLQGSKLSNIIEHHGYSGVMNLNKVLLNNVASPITSATVNGKTASVTKNHDVSTSPLSSIHYQHFWFLSCCNKKSNYGSTCPV